MQDELKPLPQDHWTVVAAIKSARALIEAGNLLCFQAETTGGTSGYDAALCAAIAHWAKERDKHKQLLRIIELEGHDPEIGVGAPQPVADHALTSNPVDVSEGGLDDHLADYLVRAHAQEIERLKKEQDALLDALFDAVALIGHAMPMNTTALIGGEKMSAIDVWQKGHDLMFPRKQLIKDATDAE